MELDPALAVAAIGLVLDPANESAPWKAHFDPDQQACVCVKCQRSHEVQDTVGALIDERTCLRPRSPDQPSHMQLDAVDAPAAADAPAEYVQHGKQLQQWRAEQKAMQAAGDRDPSDVCDGPLVLRGDPGTNFGEFSQSSSGQSGGGSLRRYTCLKVLGEGRSGKVFLAACHGPSPAAAGSNSLQLSKVAIKQFTLTQSHPPHLITNDYTFERGALEQLRRLRIFMVPNLWDELEPVGTHDVDGCEHRLLAMTFFEAPSIDDLLEHAQTFTPEEVVAFLEQMCILFYRIHEEANLIHCDVSTSNILVWRAPDTGKLPQFAVLDFANGTLRRDREDLRDASLGIPSWEHRLGVPIPRLGAVDLVRGRPFTSTDKYSIGTVALQMLTGVQSGTEASLHSPLHSIFIHARTGEGSPLHPSDRWILERIMQIPERLLRVLSGLLQDAEILRIKSAVELWGSLHSEGFLPDIRERDFVDDSDSFCVRQQVRAVREALSRSSALLNMQSGEASNLALPALSVASSSSSSASSSAPTAATSVSSGASSSSSEMQQLANIRAILSISHTYSDPRQVLELIRCIIGADGVGSSFQAPEPKSSSGSTVIDFQLPKKLVDTLASKCADPDIIDGLRDSGFTRLEMEGHPHIILVKKGDEPPLVVNPLVFWGSAFIPAGFQRHLLTASEFWRPSMWSNPTTELQRNRAYFRLLSKLPRSSFRRAFMAMQAVDPAIAVEIVGDVANASPVDFILLLRKYYKAVGMNSDLFRLRTREQLAKSYEQCTGRRPTNFKRSTKKDLIELLVELFLGPNDVNENPPLEVPSSASKARAKSKSMLGQLVIRDMVKIGDILELRGYNCKVLEQGLIQYMDKDGSAHILTGSAWAKAVLKAVGVKPVPHAALKQAFVYPMAGGKAVSLASLHQAASTQEKDISGPAALDFGSQDVDDVDVAAAVPPAKAFDVQEEIGSEAAMEQDDHDHDEDDQPEVDLANPLNAAARFMIPLGHLEAEARSSLLARLKNACGRSIRLLPDLCEDETLGVAFDEMVLAGSMLGVLSQAVWRGSVSNAALEDIVLSKLKTSEGDLAERLDMFMPQAKKLVTDLGIPHPKQSTTRDYLSDVMRETSGKRGHAALFDDVAATILAHTLQIDIHVFFRDSNRVLAVKSYEASMGQEDETGGARHHVVMLGQVKKQGRTEYWSLRAKSIVPTDEGADAVSESTIESQVQPKSVHGMDFQWDVHEDARPDNRNPDDPALLTTRVSSDGTKYEWVRTSVRTGTEEVIATQPVPRKRQRTINSSAPASIRDYLHELLELDSCIAGQEKTFDLVCKLANETLGVIVSKKDAGSNMYGENSETIRTILESGLTGSHSISISRLMVLRIFLVGFTHCGKSTLLSSLLYMGMLSVENFRRLISRVKHMLGDRVRWNPVTCAFFGFINGTTLPDDHDQKLKVLADVGHKTAVAALAASGSKGNDGDTSFMFRLMEKLEERAGSEVMKVKFEPGIILPAVDVNATTSVSVFGKLSPIPYCVTSFITEDEHETAKEEALEARDRLARDKSKGRGERSPYDGETGFDRDSDEEKILRALSMVGKEGLVNAQGKRLDEITPLDLEFDEEIAEMKLLRGRNLLYVSGTENREEAMFGIQKMLGLFTANGIRSCWGLVKWAEFGVPSKSCDGFVFCDCVGSSSIDTVRRAAAAQSGMGGQIDVLLHVVGHQNTPSDVFSDLTEPIRSLILKPKDHAVIMAYDAHNGKTKEEMTDARVKVMQDEVEQRVKFTEWRPVILSMIPEIENEAMETTSIDENAIMDRLSFVPFCAAPSYFKAQARGAGEEANLKQPQLEQLCQKLRELRDSIAQQRLRARFQEEVETIVLHSLRLLYDSITLQLQPLSSSERQRIDEELQNAERRLRDTLQALKSLGYRELYNRIEQCEERIRSHVLGAYSRLEVCNRASFERQKDLLEQSSDKKHKKIYMENKKPYVERNSRRLRQLLNSPSRENAPVFKYLFGNFLTRLPTTLVDQLQTLYSKVLTEGIEKDPISIKGYLEERLMLGKLAYGGQDDDTPRVKEIASGILKRTKRTLEEAIARFFNSDLPSALNEFIRTTLKDAFIDTINSELEYYLGKAMKKKKNTDRFDALLQTMAAPWQDTENTCYEQSILNVCDKVEGEIAKQFGKFKTSIPQGFREIVLSRVEELANARANPITDLKGFSAERKAVIKIQWQLLLNLLDHVFNTAKQNKLVTIDDSVHDAYLEFRAECTL